MKRTIPFAIVILLAAGIAFVAVDQTRAMAGKQDESKEMMCKGTMHKEMMHKEMMEHRQMPMMCPMHSMMCQGMMHKEMVATQDGGVIVMVDNKLLKYDKDVNFVKEVELKIDTEAMQGKMHQMMKECMEKCQMTKPQEKPAGMKTGSM
jgi:hypothetical protein